MNTEYEIREATALDLISALAALRPEDARECHAQRGVNFFREIREQFNVKEEPWYAGLAGGELLCIFGVGGRPTTLSGTACVWMLATENLEKRARPFARHSREVVRVLISQNSYLFNFVDERNVLAVRWLRWLGFTVLEAVQYGVKGERFHPFYMERVN